MKRALLLALFVPAVATAELLPDGCYVAFNNPGSCYTSQSGFYEWDAWPNRSFGVMKYGYAVEAIIYQWDLAADAAELCVSDYNGLVNDYNALLAQKNALAGNVNALNTQSVALQNQVNDLNAQLAGYNETSLRWAKLVSKLRKACGAKCKKIKW